MDNFRSPRKLVEAINRLQLVPEPVQGRSAHLGEAPGFHTYSPGRQSVRALDQCVTSLLSSGFKPGELAVITFTGRERSAALACERIAGLAVKRSTGKYDAAGNALWTAGDLLVETIYRFKGQSAPVVVLCEIDFDDLGQKELRKLFVGFTRAQFRLECVLSERAAEMLLAR